MKISKFKVWKSKYRSFWNMRYAYQCFRLWKAGVKPDVSR